MKKLSPLENICDCKILIEIAKNTNLGSYPNLLNKLDCILFNYYVYIQENGDPWHITPSNISDSLKKNLIKHYNHPPKGLEFIEFLRSKYSPDVCPMCGSLSTCTIDHYLPKNLYPEFSFFSINLLPACNCNIKRKEIIKGNNINERILHPYFDNFLNQRILYCLFENDLEYPDITIKTYDIITNERESIQFHVDNIINKTNIISWLGKKWSTLKLSPKLIISTLPEHTVTTTDVANSINEFRLQKDNEFQTPNSWVSIFLSGLLDSPNVVNWLTTQYNRIINQQ